MCTNHQTYIQAGLQATPADMLKDLAQNFCETVRTRVAENGNTPVVVLQTLSRDGSPEVRLAVALNPQVPSVLLWELAEDNNPDVRFCIAENPHVDIELLIWLAADENPYVALRAEKTIEDVTHDATNKGGSNMSAGTIERTFRRMLSTKRRLTKNDAMRLKKMILADGYVSRSERKVMEQAIENDLLDDDAFAIFVETLLERNSGRTRRHPAAA